MMKVRTKIWLLTLLLCVFAVQNSANAADFTFTRDLTVGISGTDVSALQQILIIGGFLKITTPTGYFGALTKTALGAWQASAGIYPSVGFFGPISKGRINSLAVLLQIAATTTPGTAATTSAVSPNDVVSSPVPPTGRPVRLKISKLNIDAGFQYLGLKSDGTMDIPNNVDDIGWFTGSPLPGEKGNSILTGHVAQIRRGVLTKPGVFINLSELRAGDKLYVINDKRETITFVVRESRLYDPGADATDVFTSKDDGAHLNLITCEGTWNQDQLSYSQRLVVFTDVVK